MTAVIKYPLEPKYKRENGLMVIDTDNLPLQGEFVVRETSVVRLPKNQIAGNHKHPRWEAYFCVEDGAQFYWLDETGQTHMEGMGASDGAPILFVISPFVPHAIANVSDGYVTLIGYADGILDGVDPVEVVSQR